MLCSIQNDRLSCPGIPAATTVNQRNAEASNGSRPVSQMGQPSTHILAARCTTRSPRAACRAHAETKDALNKAYSRMEMLRRQVKGAAGTELESASQRGTEDGAVTIDEATEEGPSQPAAAAAEGQLQGSSAAGSRAGSRPESRMSLRASASGEDYGDGGRKPAGPRAEEVAALQQQLQDQKQANNALSSRCDNHRSG